MKALALAPALLLALAAPARAKAPRAALLWLPHESFTAWGELAAALDKAKGLRLTVGLVPERMTPEGEKALSPLLAEGKLEIALRLAGDPILPLIAEHPLAPRPQDPPSRVALGRERFRLVFGAPPRGLAPGAGAVSPSLFDGFQSLGLSWVAAGDYAGSPEGWAASSGVVLVPFRTVLAAGRELGAEDFDSSSEGTGAFVLDEAGGLLAPGSALRFLGLVAAGDGPSFSWQTVSEAVEERRAGLSDAAGVAAWPSWSGGFELWNSSASEPAWRLYAEASEAIERYQNSGSADLKRLESATEALYAAQGAAYFVSPESLSEAERRRVDRRLRARLIAVYRRLRLAPPHDLFASKPEAGDEPEGIPEGSPTGVRVTRGGHAAGRQWLNFENPAGSLARPEGIPDAEAAAWRLKSLRVEWDAETIWFAWRLDASGAKLEAYADLNGVLGAGSIVLLDSKAAFLRPRDAWEYAVTVSSGAARLLRSTPQGAPALVRETVPVADPKSGTVRVALPRGLLRGNPLRWGLAAAAFPDRSAAPPASILASLEDQKAFLLGGAQGRLSAVRALEPGR